MEFPALWVENPDPILAYADRSTLTANHAAALSDGVTQHGSHARLTTQKIEPQASELQRIGHAT